ncbi:epimerase [Octadecabacter sp. 1_MG-2023]|uniref:epimerase n=1 Tax=unclassified Octadecabacter TaxID=196158 RepID=UPI001C09D0F7|nr:MULTISPECIES: epimerase [unclassified Octadecabacter]MBU2992475.1 epimerase [Octadecabacter sp. B2R22]MDO6734768.1 epimerase [Octadecabacter sp. 1_MG-2023]
MHNTVLILGPTGRMGRNAALAFEEAGWEVRRFDRKKDTLWDAAWGASVIVNAWNPLYHEWEEQVPEMTANIIEVAKAGNATVIIPGNVYTYGERAPAAFGHETPQLADNPLGKVRIDMEAAYRAADIQTIVVRAGDYIDTRASGNWFDMIMAKKAAKGVFTSPGPVNCPRAYSFLPDVAATMVALADKRASLGKFEDVNAPSYELTAEQFATAIGDLLGRTVTAKKMAWWPIQLLRPVWPVARGIVEMRYLWSKPHFLTAQRQMELCPEVGLTPLNEALRQALGHQIDPDKVVWASGKAVTAQ